MHNKTNSKSRKYPNHSLSFCDSRLVAMGSQLQNHYSTFKNVQPKKSNMHKNLGFYTTSFDCCFCIST